MLYVYLYLGLDDDSLTKMYALTEQNLIYVNFKKKADYFLIWSIFRDSYTFPSRALSA